MSRERELLERARDIFEDICDARSVGIELAICGYLSTPEPEQDEEPVGILRHNGQFELQRMVGIPISQPMKLYEHPAPRKFVRLSEDEIMELAWAISQNLLGTLFQRVRAVRAIEDALEKKNK